MIMSVGKKEKSLLNLIHHQSHSFILLLFNYFVFCGFYNSVYNFG